MLLGHLHGAKWISSNVWITFDPSIFEFDLIVLQKSGGIWILKRGTQRYSRQQLGHHFFSLAPNNGVRFTSMELESESAPVFGPRFRRLRFRPSVKTPGGTHP